MEQPSKEELDRAIERFIKKAREHVAKIPWEKRTILSIHEVEEYEKYMAEKAKKQTGL